MLDALSLDQLRTFVAVAERGSFRAGAASLSRAQSAVSQAIANLEHQLRVKLFDRSGHRPTMTPEGLGLLADARDILLRVDVMRARARDLGGALELQLGLTVDTLFPLPVVGHALRETRGKYPSVAIRLTVEPLGGPIAALLDKRCQLAIVVGEEFRDPRIAVEAVGAIGHVAVVAAAHPLAQLDAASAGPTALADHLQIVQSDPSPLSDGRSFGVLSNQVCRVSTQDAKHAMIAAGLGWGRLPLWQIERDLQEGRLVRVPTRALGRHSQVTMEAYLAHRIDEPFGLAAQAFRRALFQYPG
ncbi:LysR family transcriptional regulator [Ottowia sp. GY511]|uniref:LysR family transcriptional regulator n=1 Tax=Ottowia flava TaxID=2675430 RepID=A0ABW4KMI0_9BURK|nr:LysR family transcriptional regulator [Ottowia sp. GY511]TXK29755.1 LysR family transcriptional regulator [Ottowia sp. GY511]